MPPVQEPVCTTDYMRTRIDATLIRAEIVHPDSFYAGNFLEEEDTTIRKRAESISQSKLPIYQAAAVVSTVLAGVESQLFVFFKSSPDFTQQRIPVTLQYILVLTYIALIFSVIATISSLILTKLFGNIPMLVERLQEEKIRSVAPRASEFKRPRDDIASWRSRLLECHWLFMLAISVLCLPAQILLYIWTQEKIAISAAVSVAGVFAMLPILHFLPIPRRGMRAQGKRDLSPYPRYSSWDGSKTNLLPAPAPLPPAAAISTVRSKSKTSY